MLEMFAIFNLFLVPILNETELQVIWTAFDYFFNVSVMGLVEIIFFSVSDMK